MDWLKQCPNITELYALFGEVEDEAQHYLFTADKTIKKYLDGSTEKYSDTFVNCFHSANFNCEDTKDSENLADLSFCQGICDWVKEQGKIKNYPQFDGCMIHDVYPLPENPQVAGVDVNHIAKFAISFRTEYLEL